MIRQLVHWQLEEGSSAMLNSPPAATTGKEKPPPGFWGDGLDNFDLSSGVSVRQRKKRSS